MSAEVREEQEEKENVKFDPSSLRYAATRMGMRNCRHPDESLTLLS